MADPRVTATSDVYEMTAEGAWNDDSVCWLSRRLYPTREAARSFYADWCGVRWIEVKVHARHCRHDPDNPLAPEFDGEYWAECDKDEPGAFPVWRCE